MKRRHASGSSGFSLVELLATVLVLGVLASVAVPLYTSQRQSAAGRVCRANQTVIASAAAAWALRHEAYPARLDDMLGAPEGLARMPKCPLGGTYGWAVADTGAATITCPNAAMHVGFGGNDPTVWMRTMAPPGRDSLP